MTISIYAYTTSKYIDSCRSQSLEKKQYIILLDVCAWCSSLDKIILHAVVSKAHSCFPSKKIYIIFKSLPEVKDNCNLSQWGPAIIPQNVTFLIFLAAHINVFLHLDKTAPKKERRNAIVEFPWNCCFLYIYFCNLDWINNKSLLILPTHFVSCSLTLFRKLISLFLPKFFLFFLNPILTFQICSLNIMHSLTSLFVLLRKLNWKCQYIS